MIARNAENAFWLLRYIERIHKMSQMILTHIDYGLEIKLPVLDRWLPLFEVTGESEQLLVLFKNHVLTSEQIIIDYLTWDKETLTSLYSMIYRARENARKLGPEIISKLWETINTLWLWVKSKKTNTLFKENHLKFYQTIIQYCEQIYGILFTYNFQDESYSFMKLGLVLERSNLVARILEAKFYSSSMQESLLSTCSYPNSYLSTVLKSCFALEFNMKHTNDLINKKNIMEFLILSNNFTHSILFCIIEAKKLLINLNPNENTIIKERSYFLIFQLLKILKQINIDDLANNKASKHLSILISSLSEICNSIHEDFFIPKLQVAKNENEIKQV